MWERPCLMRTKDIRRFHLSRSAHAHIRPRVAAEYLALFVWAGSFGRVCTLAIRSPPKEFSRREASSFWAPAGLFVLDQDVKPQATTSRTVKRCPTLHTH